MARTNPDSAVRQLTLDDLHAQVARLKSQGKQVSQNNFNTFMDAFQRRFDAHGRQDKAADEAWFACCSPSKHPPQKSGRLTPNPRPNQSRPSADQIKHVFASLIESAPEGSFTSPVRLVLDDEMALCGRDPGGRAQAATDGDAVYVAQKLLSAPEDRQRGVLAHELGHVHLIQHGWGSHTEREADEAAHSLFGFVVRYDGEDVQTSGRGSSPRPARLDKGVPHVGRMLPNPAADGTDEGGCVHINPGADGSEGFSRAKSFDPASPKNTSRVRAAFEHLSVEELTDRLETAWQHKVQLVSLGMPVDALKVEIRVLKELLREQGAEGIRSNPGRDPATMTASQINKELDKLDVERSELNEEFINAGRGHEKSSQTAKASDPLALRFNAITDRSNSLRNEIHARYGPGAPSRMPKGLAPRVRSNPGRFTEKQLDALAEAFDMDEDESTDDYIDFRVDAVVAGAKALTKSSGKRKVTVLELSKKLHMDIDELKKVLLILHRANVGIELTRCDLPGQAGMPSVEDTITSEIQYAPSGRVLATYHLVHAI